MGIKTSYEEVKAVRENPELNPTLSEKILELHDLSFEEDTDLIAGRVNELAGVAAIIAKKSRVHADANRFWFTRENRKEKITAFEYSRSVRAAYYWATRKIVESMGILDKNHKVNKPCVRISVHGMKDNDGFDFAIGASNDIADQDFLKWFCDRLNEKVADLGLNIGGETPKALLAFAGDEKTGAYSGAESLKPYRIEKKPFHHPAFGPDFQSVQIEISNRLRKDEGKRELVAQAISEVIKEIPNYNFKSSITL